MNNETRWFYNLEKKQTALPYLTVHMISLGQNKKLYLSTLLENADPKERDLIRLLCREEMSYSRHQGITESQDTKEFNVIRIEKSRTIEVLKALAASGKLHFDKSKLYCHFFSACEFFYKGKEAASQALEVEGFLALEKEELPLAMADLVFLGPPHWFIYKNTLRLIKEELPSRWIEPVIHGACLLDARKKETLIENCRDKDFSSIPRLELSCTTSKEPSKEPLPVLKLTDRLGSFATLWMDYGPGQRVSFHEKSLFPRIEKSEKEFERDLLETDFIFSPRGSSMYYCPLDKVIKSIVFLLECGWTILDIKGRKILRGGEHSFDFELKNQSILVKGKYLYDTFDANIQDVVGAFNRRDNFVQLSSSEYVGLLEHNLAEIQCIQDGEIVTEGVRIKNTHFGLLGDVWKSVSLPKSLEKMREYSTLLENERFSIERLPGKNFIAELRPYQQVGFQWLCFLDECGFGGLLADDMGLGKTVQVLAYLSTVIGRGPVLIVVPTTLVFHWKKEVLRFLKEVQVYVHQGNARTQDVEFFNNFDIVITSYTLLRMDVDLLSKVDFYVVVLDEAHNIKNPDTQVAKAACLLQAHSKFSLTGTPVENHLQDLWSQFHFLMPGLLQDRKGFDASMRSASLDATHFRRLKKLIKPFFLRRSKKEVAKDLPEKMEQVVWVEMDSYQRDIYENFLASVRSGVLKKVAVDGMKKHKMEVFEAILRLRQICCHPGLLQAYLDLGEVNTGGGKWEALLDDIHTVCEEGRKVLVYSQFTHVLKLLLKELKVRGKQALYLDGTTKNREELVVQFQEDKTAQIFLMSLKAGGVGLNLTAADYVFIYDPWWNEAVENQAIDRAHRIGREERVIAKRYITALSIEEKIMKLKASKNALVQGVLEEEWESGQFTEEDLLELFD